MSGATGSGDEMETGRVNRAEGRTMVWAQVPPGQPNFNGPAVFIVETAQDALDPDDYEDLDTFVPSNPYHGLIATGHSGHGTGGGFGGAPGAHGVVGRGGRAAGSGVLGLGGGTPEAGGGGGRGGIGVHGVGGANETMFAELAVVPGCGVVGQGGRQDDGTNTDRLPHAAGVIGIGGGSGRLHDDLQQHPLAQTGGTGVYGKGAGLEITMVRPSDASGPVEAPDVPSGPGAPGTGVVGRGGVSVGGRTPSGAGVVGIAGDGPLPELAASGDVGVFGSGDSARAGTGVRGRSGAGVGVHGQSSHGRGGVFESEFAAQLQLRPRRSGDVFGSTVPASPRQLVTDRAGTIHLPKDGRVGDIIAVVDDEGDGAYWCCVHGADAGAARWAQLLLGSAFDGDA